MPGGGKLPPPVAADQGRANGRTAANDNPSTPEPPPTNHPDTFSNRGHPITHRVPQRFGYPGIPTTPPSFPQPEDPDTQGTNDPNDPNEPSEPNDNANDGPRTPLIPASPKTKPTNPSNHGQPKRPKKPKTPSATECAPNPEYPGIINLEGRKKPLLGLFKVQGTIDGHPAIILIDNGSTNNFLSASFAAEHRVKTMTSPSQTVKMANGTLVTQDKKASRVSLAMGIHSETTDFDILPLDGYDAILGQPWLRKRGALIDCKTDRVSFTHRGRVISLQPNTTPVCGAARQRRIRGEETLISAHQLDNLVRAGHSVFAAFIKFPTPSDDACWASQNYSLRLRRRLPRGPTTRTST